MEADTDIIVVKGSINTIGWKPGYREALELLVQKVNWVTKNALLFLKHIFVCEKAGNPDWDLKPWICERFIQEVWESLMTHRQTPLSAGSQDHRNAIARYYNLINFHLPIYKVETGFEQVPLQYTQQIALYQAKAIYTAYMNNVKEHFGNHWDKMVVKLAD